MKLKFIKAMSFFLTLIFTCTTFLNPSLISLAANDVTGKDAYTQLVPYPLNRYDWSEDTWGHPAVNFLNGSYNEGENAEAINWKVESSTHYSAKYVTVDSGNTWEVAYCIQPGTDLNSGDKQTGSKNFLDKYSNDALNSDDVQRLLGRVLKYGYQYSGSSIPSKEVLETDNVSYSPAAEALTNDEVAEMIATQLLVWEVIVGERTSDFDYTYPENEAFPDGYNRVKSIIDNHPFKQGVNGIDAHYDAIATAVAHYTDIPSFMSDKSSSDILKDMEWNGFEYTITLTDSNGVLDKFNFTSATPGINFSKNGNELTITTTKMPKDIIGIYAENPNTNGGGGIAVWAKSDKTIKDNTKDDTQALITQLDDPVHAYLKLRVGSGTIKVEKLGELLSGSKEIEKTPIETTYKLTFPVYEERLLRGAEFEIKSVFDVYYNGVEVKAGDVITTITTDSDGTATANLRLCTYYAVETKAPYGMVIDTTPHEFILCVNNDEKELDELDGGVHNKRQKVEISLKKKCDTPKKPDPNINPLEDIVFGIYAREDIKMDNGETAIKANKLIDCVRIDSNGDATFEVDLPFGKYYVEELETHDCEKCYYFLHGKQYNIEFKYAGQDVDIVKLSIGEPINNTLATKLTIKKDFPKINPEHATCDGDLMTAPGGQNWEKYTTIKVGDVKNGTFKSNIIIEKQNYIVGEMWAVFTKDGDLEIHYKTLKGIELRQDARLEIVDNTGKFYSKAFGDLTFKSDVTDYKGATEGYITIPASELKTGPRVDSKKRDISRNIDINDDDQEFYVFLRLSRVAGDIYSLENLSWINSGYQYEFMVFDLDDFESFIGKGKDYADKSAVQKAIQTNIVGVLKNVKPINITELENGINPAKYTCPNPYCQEIIKARGYCNDELCDAMTNCSCRSVFCEERSSVTFKLPAYLSADKKYLVAEIFRNPDGSIINNPDFVNITGNSSLWTMGVGDEKEAVIKNDFSIMYDSKYDEWRKLPSKSTITNSVSTDETEYFVGEDVKISSLIKNTSDIDSVKKLSYAITVRKFESDNYEPVKVFTAAIADIKAGDFVLANEVWDTTGRAAGKYAVYSEVYADGILVETANTVIISLKEPNPLPTLELIGELAISPKKLKSDETLTISTNVLIKEGENIKNGKVVIKIIDTANNVVFSKNTSLNLNASDNFEWIIPVIPQKEFTSVDGKNYSVVYEVFLENEDEQSILVLNGSFQFDDEAAL